MEQHLQSADLLRTEGREVRVARKKTGEEVVLIGKAPKLQTAPFSTLGEIRPFDVRGNVAIPYVLQRRGQQAVTRIALQRAGPATGTIEVVPGKPVIGDKHHSSHQLWRQRVDPIEGGQINLRLIKAFRRWRNFRDFSLQS